MTGEHSQFDSRLSRRQRHVVIALAVVCIVASGAAIVAAQSATLNGNQFSDDFEDGNLAEYNVQETGEGTVEVRNGTDLGGPDNNVLFLESGDEPFSYAEYDGTFNLTNTIVNAEADFRVDDNGGIGARVIDLNNGTERIRVEASYNQGLFLNGTFLEGGSASPSGGTTIIPLSELPNGEENPESNLHVNVSIDFDAEQVNVTAYNDTQTWTATDDFSYVPDRTGWTYSARIRTGSSGDPLSRAWVDNVSVTGRSPGTLSLNINNFQRPGTEQHYTVEFEDEDGTTSDVTSNATVTSSHPDVLTVNDSRNVLNATENSSQLPQEVTITAEYENRTVSKNVTVAAPSLQNIDLLPAWWKVSALFNDERGTDTMLWLFAAVLAGITAARIASTFAGLGAYEMFVIFGWITGEVSDGVLIASLLMAIFLGLNLAANIDYSVRQT